MRASVRRFSLWAVCPSLVAVLLSVPSLTYAQPPAASRGIASGELSGERLTFSWGAVPTATWYYLWITDSTGPKVQNWYTSAQLGCDIRPLCSLTIDLSLQPGEITWWVQTWSPLGFGPWSEPQQTTMRPKAEETFGVYDSAGNRFASVVSFDRDEVGWPAGSAIARVQIGERTLLLRIYRTEVRQISGEVGQIYYQGGDCTGTPMISAGPNSLLPPSTVTQPGSMVWVAADGGQHATRHALSYWLAGFCAGLGDEGAPLDGYEAISLGPFPYTAPYSVR
jgi:hypothetical protein